MLHDTEQVGKAKMHNFSLTSERLQGNQVIYLKKKGIDFYKRSLPEKLAWWLRTYPMSETEFALEAAGGYGVHDVKSSVPDFPRTTHVSPTNAMTGSKQSVVHTTHRILESETMPIVFSHFRKDTRKAVGSPDAPKECAAKEVSIQIPETKSRQEQAQNNREEGYRVNIQNAVLLEFVQIACDVSQYTNLKLSGQLECAKQEGLLLAGMSYGLLMAIFFRVAANSRNIKWSLSPASNEWNWHGLLVIFHLLVIDVVRFELLLETPTPRLVSLILTFLVNQILLGYINLRIAKYFTIFIACYLHIRFLASMNSYVYLFVNAGIVMTLTISKCYLGFRWMGSKDQGNQKKKKKDVQPEIKQLQQPILNKETLVSIEKLREMEQSKKFYHRIVSMMPQGVLIVDSNEKFVYANKTTKKILSCTSKNAIPMRLKQLIVKNAPEQTNEFIRDRGQSVVDTIAMMATGGARAEQKKATRTLRTLKSFQSNHSLRIKRTGTPALGGEQQSMYYDSESHGSPNFGRRPSQITRTGGDKRHGVQHSTSAAMRLYQKSISVFSNVDAHSSVQFSSSRTPPSQSVIARGSSPLITQSDLARQQHTISQQTQQDLPDYHTSQQDSSPHNFEGMSVMEIIRLLIKNQSQRTQEATLQPNVTIKKKADQKVEEISLRQIPLPFRTSIPVEEQQLFVSKNREDIENLCFSDHALVKLYQDPQNFGYTVKDAAQKTQMQSEHYQTIISNEVEQIIPAGSSPHNLSKMNKTHFSSSSHNIERTSRRTYSQKHNKSFHGKTVAQSNYQHQVSSYAPNHTKDKLIKQQTTHAHYQSGSLRSISHSRQGDIGGAAYPGGQPNRLSGGSNSGSSWHTNANQIGQTVHNGIAASGIGNTIKKNTAIAQNSVTIRIKLNEKIIEITFVDCLVSQTQNQHLRKKKLKKGDDTPGSRNESMILIFFEDITNEVYMHRLEELNHYKMRMLSSVSHELKTPLNCSMGMLSELYQYLESEDVKIDPNSIDYMMGLVEPAQQSNVLLLSMIRDLLDLGTLEMGEQIQYAFTTFNLKQMLEDHCNVIKSQAQLKEITIKLDFNECINEEVTSDEIRLSQIIINFLTNSLKFTGKNGQIIVRVESTHDDHFKISVEDDGIGISSKKIQELFQVFADFKIAFQTQPTTKGIGLGLSVSFHLAKGLTLRECQDKPISVISEEKKGTIFSFILKNQEASSVQQFDDHQNDALIHSIVPSPFVLQESHENENQDSQDDNDEVIHIPGIVVPHLRKEYSSVKESPVEDAEKQCTSRRNYDDSIEEQKLQKIGNGQENIQADFQDDDTQDNIHLKLAALDSDRLKQRQGSYFNLLDKFYSEPEDQAQNLQVNSQRDNLFAATSIHSEPLSPNPLNPSSQLLPVSFGPPANESPTTLSFGKNLALKPLHQQGNGTANGAGSVGSIPTRKNLSRLSQNGLFSTNNSTSILNVESMQTIDDFIIQNIARVRLLSSHDPKYGDLLIVDDVQFNLMTLKSLLKKYAMSIDVAHDGQEAFDKVKAKYTETQQLYRVIFMDIQMPVKDGFEATQDIRKFLEENGQQQIPIVATSAFGDASYKEQAKKVGMTDYIEKPIKQSSLDKIILKHVASQQASYHRAFS